MRKDKGKEILTRILKDAKVYGLVFLLFVSYYLLVRIRFHAFCPLVIVTGFPCPGCGMTRAMLCLLTGQFQRAWNLNPSSFLWLGILIWFLYARYWRGNGMGRLRYLIMLTVITMVCIYGYRMLTVFPSYPPMTYTRHNLMSESLPWYQEYVDRILAKR
ncbi:MAG: DUF2752 domain-containing protein [Lachnospiraceae bacterium]|nr:DUF2752 domain-containing protein [Lachnospiraceae bacterium]